MRTIAFAAAILCAITIPAAAEPVWNTGWNFDRYEASQGRKAVRGRVQQPRVQSYRSKRIVKVRRNGRTVRVVRYVNTQRVARQERNRINPALSPAIAREPIAQVGHAVTGIIGGGGSIVSAMASDIGRNLRGVYRGLPYCGLYMGTIVQRLGYQPPAGHALARNWRNFGVNAGGPAKDVIMVTNGHVGVVKEVLPGGRVVLRGGNQGGGRVNDITVSVHRAIAWRRPS